MFLNQSIKTCLIGLAAVCFPAWSQAPNCLSSSTTATAVDMRLLVIAADGTEVVLPGIISTLKHLGIPHDVLIARDQVLDASVLCSSVGLGQGRYQSVLLTTGSLGFQNMSGAYESALTWEEWNLLWSYEAKYRVRQATFYTFPGGWPDNYGLSAPTAGIDTTTTPIQTQLTTTSPAGSGNPSGRQVFSDLRPAAPIVISNAYTYLATAISPSVTPLLTDPQGNVIASINNYPDGRKNLALTADGNAFLSHSLKLNYGIINWVTKGLYLGQRNVFMTAQPDDLLVANDMWDPATNTDTSGKTYRLTASDYNKFIAWQTNRNNTKPGNIVVEIPFNAIGSTSALPPEERYPALVDDLTPAVKANSSAFFWVSHTFSHPYLDAPLSYSTMLNELRQNDQTARNSLRLSGYFKDSLVTPNISGLNNVEALRAMKDFGIRYLVSDTSKFCGNRNETVPPRPCPPPNHGIQHDLEPSLLMIPRYPSNLFYNVCTPAEWVSEYNFIYRSFWGRDLSYAEILGKESDTWLGYLLSFDMRPIMFHQPNMCAYDGSRSLLGDLIDATVAKYSAISVLAPKSRQQRQIGNLMLERMRLAAALAPATGPSFSAKIVFGSVSSRIELSNPTSAALVAPVTGVSAITATSRENLGGQTTSKMNVPANSIVSVTSPLVW
jgi:hypothetical protein